MKLIRSNKILLPISGFLMGLANLVPGVSGGTMILITGMYPRFIKSIRDISRGNFNYQSLTTLGTIGLVAVITIVLTAPFLEFALSNYSWILYSLFIGLTVGGIQPISRQITNSTKEAYIGGISGFILIIGIVILSPNKDEVYLISLPFLVFSGILCGAAMIVPGISGNSLLIAIGSYESVVSIVSKFKIAMEKLDINLLRESIKPIILFGLGVLFGIATISVLINWLIKNKPNETFSTLLGMLIGTIFALWPFEQENILSIEFNKVLFSLIFVTIGFLSSFFLDNFLQKKEIENG